MTRKCISFKENEKDLLEYMESKRSPSNYIKDLIFADLYGSKAKDTKSHNKTEETAENEEFTW